MGVWSLMGARWELDWSYVGCSGMKNPPPFDMAQANGGDCFGFDDFMLRGQPARPMYFYEVHPKHAAMLLKVCRLIVCKALIFVNGHTQKI